MMRVAVTGASRGIGAAICDQLTRIGWDVVRISRADGCDVTTVALEEWLDHFAPFDALVTCAGWTPPPQPLLSITDREWADSWAVNFDHHMRAVRWFAKQGRAGPVVVVSSTAGTRPSPEWTPYAAAKAALINFAVSIHAELAPSGFRVYALTPGRCATALRATLAPDEDPDSIMQPFHVAAVVEKLFDDVDGVLAGQAIKVAMT